MTTHGVIECLQYKDREAWALRKKYAHNGIIDRVSQKIYGYERWRSV
jgi:hypothetical protein